MRFLLETLFLRKVRCKDGEEGNGNVGFGAGSSAGAGAEDLVFDNAVFAFWSPF